jgi:hypothetical protein
MLITAPNPSATRSPQAWNEANPNDAATSLGPMSTDSDAIVIEDFVSHRGLSDEVNSARFVERGGLEPPER